MKKFIEIASAALAWLQPKSNKLEIDTYGQSSTGLPPEEVQKVMEWLLSSLLKAGYLGKAHFLWDDGDQDWNKTTLTGLLRDEPVFLYRCGSRPSEPPKQCYWRLMPEYQSMRIYQLEMKDNK